MAAYAALTSLLTTMKLLSNISGVQKECKHYLKLIYEEFVSLQEFLDGEPTFDLQVRIKDAAHEAEDEVESLVKQLMEQDEVGLCEKLDKIHKQAKKKIDSFREQLIVPNKNKNLQAANSQIGGFFSERADFSTLEVDMVGRTVEEKSVISQLTKGSHNLEVISIAGMGGIGKSTFVKSIFLRLSTKSHFQICGWITVSERCNFEKMLRVLLKDTVRRKEEELDNKVEGELAGLLKRSLRGVRYLIVVDDIWSEDDWDRIRQWFPDCGEKSRILLISRDKKVAEYAASLKTCLEMCPLKVDESRKLFERKAFVKNDKHPRGEFEKVGKEVVEKCKGLPLMICAAAGILSSKTTLDEWSEVAESMSSLVSDDVNQQCSQVLGLSYKHLPFHMKACFLHFGVFQKGSEISSKKLIRLWVAGGLLRLNEVEEPEKVGAMHLHYFVDKNLVIVEKRSLDGKIKVCRIHDLFHNFCLREAARENLLYDTEGHKYFPEDHRCVSKKKVIFHCGSVSAAREKCYLPKKQQKQNKTVREKVLLRRWVSIHSGSVFSTSMNFDGLTSSKTRAIYFNYNDAFPSYLDSPIPFKLVRVLDLQGVEIYRFPTQITHLVCLRYLAVSIHRSYDVLPLLPIYNLWNLQTLIVGLPRWAIGGCIYLPNAIWKMSQLRHLYLRGTCGWSLNAGHLVLVNLQSLSGLSPSCCTKEILQGIKKVKRLDICGDLRDFLEVPKWIDNLKYLQDLEELRVIVSHSFMDDRCFSLASPDSLPQNLKKLKLRCTNLPWEYMSFISKLPELEILQLEYLAFKGNGWEVKESGFDKLKFLLIDFILLDYWRSTSPDHFPSLERVIIKNCSFLKEIPRGFEDSETLELIELHRCVTTLVSFAESIQTAQANFGISKLKVKAFDTVEDFWGR